MSLTVGDAPDTPQIELAVRGMTCAACASRVERKLNRIEGVSASVNYATARATVSAPGLPDMAARLVRTVEDAGYGAQTIEGTPPVERSDSDHAAGLWRRLVVAVAVFIPLCDLSILFIAMPQTRFPGWQFVLLALALPVAGWAAWPFHRAAVMNARRGSSSMDTLVSIGITAAVAWSVYAMFFQAPPSAADGGLLLLLRPEGALYLEVAAGVTAFVLGGRYFEARAQHRAGEALRALAGLRATTVTVVHEDGSHGQIPTEALRVGQRFLVLPGSTVAADGRVVNGQGTLDSSSMTGESTPQEVDVGDAVIGGTVSLNGGLVVEADQVGADTRLAGMVRLVEQAQSGKASVQRLADRLSAYFVPAVLVLAALTLVSWLMLTGSADRAFTAGLAVLIIACPCALGLATPTALMVASGRGAQLGIFIKGYQALETTREIDTVVLDKTGTVTEGRMSVVGVECATGVGRQDLLRWSAAVEQASEHPVAAAVVETAREEVGALPTVIEFRTRTGLGASGMVDGVEIMIGRITLFQDQGWSVPEDLDARRAEWERQGRTVVLVGRDRHVVGVFALADRIKPSAADAVTQLHRLGLRTVLVTGDNEATARAVADEVGLDEVIFEVLPDDKVRVVRELQGKGRVVAVVGDGVNDAPALVTADLGLAIGSGTDIAIDAADLILVRDDLTVAPEAIALARGTLRTIRGNLLWAFAYNLAAIPLAMFGMLNPLIAGGAMALSSFFVVSNSLRLRRFSGPVQRDR